MNTNNLSRKEMRIEIAKDALSQLRKGKMRAARGSYFVLDVHQVNRESQVCEVLKTKTCEVCALGSMFASSINKYNDLIIDQLYIGSSERTNISRNETVNRLSEYFDLHQLNLVELFFEGRNVGDQLWSMIDRRLSYRYSYDNILRLLNTYLSGWIAKENLIKILQNIIANDGDFVIPRSVFRKCGMSDSDYRFWRDNLASKD